MLQVLSVCDYVSALWLTVKWIKLVFLCECYQLPQKHRQQLVSISWGINFTHREVFHRPAHLQL